MENTKKEISKIINELYSDNNYDGHGVKHINDVLDSLKRYNEQYPLTEYEYNLLKIATVFHDCDMTNRELHHLLSAIKFRALKGNYNLTKNLSVDDTNKICRIIEEHRSSAKYSTKSTLGKIMTKIDTGYPINVMNILDRTITYAIAKFDLKTPREVEDKLFLHLGKKYFRKGYARHQLNEIERMSIDEVQTYKYCLIIKDLINTRLTERELQD